MEYHRQQLAKHCRICGKRPCKAKEKSIVYSCSEYNDHLQACYDVGKDREDIHPKKFCNPCYMVTKHLANASWAGVSYTYHSQFYIEHTHTCLVSLRWWCTCSFTRIKNV